MLEIIDFLRSQVPWCALSRSQLEEVVRHLEVHYWPRGTNWEFGTRGLEAAVLLVRKGEVVVQRDRAQVDGKWAGGRVLGPGGSMFVGSRHGGLVPLGEFQTPTETTDSWIFEATAESLVYVLPNRAYQGFAPNSDFVGLWSSGFLDRVEVKREADPELPSHRFVLLKEDVTIAEALELRRRTGTEFLVLPGKPFRVLGAAEIAAWVQEAAVPEYASVSAIMQPIVTLEGSAGYLEVAFALGVSKAGLLGLVASDTLDRLVSLERLALQADSKSVRAVLRLGRQMDEAHGQWLAVSELLATVVSERPEVAPAVATWTLETLAARICGAYVQESGPAPAPYVVLSVGGWGALLPSPDLAQDHVLVWADTVKPEAGRYFLGMGEALVRGLEEAGFGRTGSPHLACQTLWCKPMGTWKGYVSAWTGRMAPEDNESLAPFLNQRPLAGDLRLAGQFADLFKSVRSSPAFRRGCLGLLSSTRPGLIQWLSSGRVDDPSSGAALEAVAVLRRLISGLDTWEAVGELSRDMLALRRWAWARAFEGPGADFSSPSWNRYHLVLGVERFLEEAQRLSVQTGEGGRS